MRSALKTRALATALTKHRKYLLVLAYIPVVLQLSGVCDHCGLGAVRVLGLLAVSNEGSSTK